MVRQIYADGIINVTYTSGMVRIDLASIPAEPGKNGDPPPFEVHERVIMTPAAFLRSVRIMEDLMRKMADSGVYNNKPQEVPAVGQHKRLEAKPVH